MNQQIKTVSFYTLGCRLNQSETAILQESFVQEGYRVLDFGQPTDVVVINTCTVTENGDADTRRLVNKIRRHNANTRIALVGCQAQTQGKKLLGMENVDWIVGNQAKFDLVEILSHTGPVPSVIVPPISRANFTLPYVGIDRNRTRANLKIQDGCDFFCSFCEIPFARGRARSRKFSDVIAAAQALIAAERKEIVITGINVGMYRDEGHSIVDVISALEGMPKLARIRISSIEATTVPDVLLQKMALRTRLCRYLHISMQSGSDPILQAMNRRYTRDEFSEFICRAVSKVPDLCIGTDVIVGFPGETEERFQQTYALLKDLPIVYFHVFSYSDREHHKSRKFPDKVPAREIEMRSKLLRDLSARKRRVYLQSMIGKTETVLFESRKKNYWTGLTDTYIRVRVESDLDLANQIVPVKLDRVDQQVMTGSLL